VDAQVRSVVAHLKAARPVHQLTRLLDQLAAQLKQLFEVLYEQTQFVKRHSRVPFAQALDVCASDDEFDSQSFSFFEKTAQSQGFAVNRQLLDQVRDAKLFQNLVVVLASEHVRQNPLFEHLFRRCFALMWHVLNCEGGVVLLKD